MKMKLIKLTILATVCVAGCSSFNRYTYLTPQEQQRVQAEQKAEQVIQKAKQIRDTKCENFEFSKLPATPVAPVQELQRTNPNDHRRIEGIMMTYVEQLRAHDKQVRKIVAYDQRRHDQACRAVGTEKDE